MKILPTSLCRQKAINYNQQGCRDQTLFFPHPPASEPSARRLYSVIRSNRETVAGGALYRPESRCAGRFRNRPTKLEQRIGRIKRFGQVRDRVDMLNLVNEQTVDEKVYECLSERMRNRFDLFGSLPDTIKDEWIEDIELLGEKMDQCIQDHRRATGFDLRYNTSMQRTEHEWRDCSQVLSQRDFASLMREGWN